MSVSTQDTLNHIVTQVRAKQRGNNPNQYEGHCPVHKDQNASLSVCLAANKNILIDCKSGCSTDSIIKSLGLQMKDLFASSQVPQKPFKRTVATYDYVNPQGELLFQCVRYEPKDFRQRQPNLEKKGSWIWNLKGVQTVLYNLPLVLSTAKAGGRVLLVEGEKDANTLSKLGYCATTAPMGAKKNWSDNLESSWKRYSKTLEGADVIIIPDNDPVGIKHADKVSHIIQETAKRVRILRLPKLKEKGDVTDWINAGGTKDQLEKLINTQAKEPSQPPLWLSIDSKTGRVSVVQGVAAQVFADSWKGDLLFHNTSFWKYKSGLWKRIEDGEIALQISEMLTDTYAKQRVIGDILYLVQLKLRQDEAFEFDKEPSLLNFKNGMLNLNTYQFGEHQREVYKTTQLPFDYDETATCAQWFQFLESLELEQNTYNCLQEWAGYVLYVEPINKRIEKCLFLKGGGSNGKSVFLETLSAMWGNVSSLDVSEMFERFKVAELQGKIANVCTDIESRNVFSNRFKRIVSGEKITAEYKNKPSFEFRPFSKIIFSANDFMPTRDHSHGFFRRFCVIEFHKTFSPAEQDPDLKEKLLTELPGIFRWSLGGLDRLRKNNWKLSESEEMKRVYKEFVTSSDPLRQFIEEHCEMEAGGSIETTHFRREYKEWCDMNGYSPLAESRLGREMRELGYDKNRRRSERVLKYFYDGISLKSESPFCS